MADIRHRVGIGATPDATYRALSTAEGLSGWWTREVQGDPAVGGRLRFVFGDLGTTVMEVTELVPGQRVAWRCVEGADEWVGTDLTFDLSASGSETVMLFTQAGWREPVPFMHHCSTKWAVFLLGLKAGLEGGAATPFPDDPAISSWG
jgi:uncharacterized protein YndB with AHSA1/START domain